MTNPALTDLHDIHLPLPPHWWPLAPGWYVVIVAGLFLLILLLYWEQRYWRRHAPKRAALILLKSYYQTYLENSDQQMACTQISALLRRIALVYYPRSEVASLAGESWIQFLNHTGRTNIDFNLVRVELLTAPYKSGVNGNIELVFRLSRRWIQAVNGRYRHMKRIDHV